jgi:DNA polymerase III subunit beta
MKFVCVKNYLLSALNNAESIIEKNSALPVLQNVLIEASKGKVVVSATNLEIGTHISLQAKVEDEGALTAPVKTLLGFLMYASDEKVQIQTKNNVIYAVSGAQKAEIKGLDPKEFPIIPVIKEEQSYKISAGEFLSALSSLIFLTAASETRPELSGIFCVFERGQLRMAATDGFRLGEYILKGIQGRQEGQYILPSRTVVELMRIFADAAEIEAYVSANQIVFKTADKELISRLIEGKYPDYSAILPTSFTTRVYVNKSEFIQILRGAGVFSGKNRDIKLSLLPDQKTCRVESKNSDIGEQTAEVACEGEGKPLVLSCNYQYLLDAFGKFKEESVSIEGNRETDPVMLKEATKIGTRYLVMPLRSM